MTNQRVDRGDYCLQGHLDRPIMFCFFQGADDDIDVLERDTKNSKRGGTFRALPSQTQAGSV